MHFSKTQKIAVIAATFVLSALVLLVLFVWAPHSSPSKAQPSPTPSARMSPDPGCTYIASALSSDQSQFQTDESSGNLAALTSDLKTLRTQVRHGESLAVHPAVKADFAKINADLGPFITDLENSSLSNIQAQAQTIGTDSQALQKDCNFSALIG